MPNYTSNYNLTKPVGTDLYDINVHNTNMDIIDENLKTISDTTDKVNERVSESPFTNTGTLVQFETYQDSPLNIVTTIKPIQSGSGNPSPSNVRNITARSNSTLSISGKNILPWPYFDGYSKTINGVTFTVNDDGSIRVKGTATSNTTFNFLPPSNYRSLPVGKYKLSGAGSGCGTNTYRLQANKIVDGVAETGAMDTGEGSTLTITTPNTMVTCYIVVLPAAGEVDDVFYPQLEVGTVATEYEKPSGTVHSLSFENEIYGGILDWKTGKLTVTHMLETLTSDKVHDITDEGTETAQFTIGTNYEVVGGNLNPTAPMSNYYNGVKWADSPWNVNYSISYYSAGRLRIKDNRYTTLSAFKAYVDEQNSAGTPIQIVYKLANPSTIQLTQCELFAVKGLNFVFSESDESTVSGRNDIIALSNHLVNTTYRENNPPPYPVTSVNGKTGAVEVYKRTLLWENSDPSQSMAIDTLINLASDDYDELLVYYTASASANPAIVTTFVPKGMHACLTTGAFPSTGINFTFRYFSRVSDVQYKLGNCYGMQISGSVVKALDGQTSRNIPVEIWGIKY